MLKPEYPYDVISAQFHVGQSPLDIDGLLNLEMTIQNRSNAYLRNVSIIVQLPQEVQASIDLLPKNIKSDGPHWVKWDIDYLPPNEIVKNQIRAKIVDKPLLTFQGAGRIHFFAFSKIFDRTSNLDQVPPILIRPAFEIISFQTPFYILFSFMIGMLAFIFWKNTLAKKLRG